MNLFSKLNALSFDADLKSNYPLSGLTWLKSGGKADVFCRPKSIYDVQILLANIDIDTEILVLGNGSNILIRDGGIRGVVIKLGSKFNSIYDHSDCIEVGAGVLNSTLSMFCLQNSIKNFSFLSCIPGSIGGAVYMNCGCYNQQISDILLECTIVNRAGQVEVLKRHDIEFSYRKSNIEAGSIILGAKFIKERGYQCDIKAQIEAYKLSRLNTQPTNAMTAGCTFLNNNGKSAWKFIKEAKCEDIMVGGAMWSKKHANFLINKGNATSLDLETLIKTTQDKIYNITGVMLGIELTIVGQNQVVH